MADGLPQRVVMVVAWAILAGAFFPGVCSVTGAEAPRWRALVSPGGRVRLSLKGHRVAEIEPGLYEAGWRAAGFSPARDGGAGQPLRGRINAQSGTVVDTELRVQEVAGGARLAYRLTPRSSLSLNSIYVGVELPIHLVAGQGFTVDGQEHEIPADFDETGLYSGQTRDLALRLRGGRDLRLAVDPPQRVLVQDNRRWGPRLVVRIGPSWGSPERWPAGKALDVSFTLTAPEGMNVEFDHPVTLQAGEDWIPLDLEMDIEPGSALDFSGMGQLDPPAGKHGRLIACDDGTFAFAERPDRPQRFYGVNLCFGAHYLPRAEADRLAERLMRLGYNTVRFHHYERDLVDRSGGISIDLEEKELDQLDYLFAALKERGLYVTTDLFVSRPVFAREVWPGAEGTMEMNDYKMAVLVNERARANLQAFSRRLLGHRNPYTGMTWAEDPALGWISLINEGNSANFIGGVSGRLAEDWRRAWNRYLGGRYGNRQALQDAWERAPGGDPAAGTVPLPDSYREESPRGHDFAMFLAHTELDFFREMKRFLREELGCRALLTNMNGWTYPLPMQAVRREFDYADEHFYVDHPRFIERRWSLPARCANTNPVITGSVGGLSDSFSNPLDQPLTVSEYNYSFPSKHRAAGGLLTGALAALQGWDTIWRFSYSHSEEEVAEPVRAAYFNLSSDALNQASDRAALCLHLRGDMRPAPHTVAIAATRDQLMESLDAYHDITPPWRQLALITGVGTFVGDLPGRVPADLILPLGDAGGWSGGDVLPAAPYDDETGPKLLDAMRTRGWLAGNRTDLEAGRFESETGELFIDGEAGMMAVRTPRTAGGYAGPGRTIEAGPVRAEVREAHAAVWVSSLDEQPIPHSARLLLTHLTDLQNTGSRFGEKARDTLLVWGDLPHLVRRGTATVTLEVRDARSARVWTLSTGGRRTAPVEARLGAAALTIPVSTAGPEGARMLYEVEIKR